MSSQKNESGQRNLSQVEKEAIAHVQKIAFQSQPQTPEAPKPTVLPELVPSPPTPPTIPIAPGKTRQEIVMELASSAAAGAYATKYIGTMGPAVFIDMCIEFANILADRG